MKVTTLRNLAAIASILSFVISMYGFLTPGSLMIPLSQGSLADGTNLAWFLDLKWLLLVLGICFIITAWQLNRKRGKRK